MHAVRHQDWKLYVPHTYRSLNGRIGTNDGFPVPYEMNEVKTPVLFDLSQDPAEQFDIADQHPAIVKKITQIADSIRLVLGDRLTGVKGNEVRPVGQIQE